MTIQGHNKSLKKIETGNDANTGLLEGPEAFSPGMHQRVAGFEDRELCLHSEGGTGREEARKARQCCRLACLKVATYRHGIENILFIAVLKLKKTKFSVNKEYDRQCHVRIHNGDQRDSFEFNWVKDNIKSFRKAGNYRYWQRQEQGETQLLSGGGGKDHAAE